MVTAPDLFAPPSRFTLPLSVGQDLYVAFLYQPAIVDANGNLVLDASGQPTFATTDYPTGATVTLVVDSVPPLQVAATIDGYTATCWAHAGDVAPIKANTKWRVVIVYPSGLNWVLCNGVTSRKDGTR